LAARAADRAERKRGFESGSVLLRAATVSSLIRRPKTLARFFVLRTFAMHDIFKFGMACHDLLLLICLFVGFAFSAQANGKTRCAKV